MDELIRAMLRFGDLDTVIAELQNYEGNETIEDIADYLNDEADYANY